MFYTMHYIISYHDCIYVHIYGVFIVATGHKRNAWETTKGSICNHAKIHTVHSTSNVVVLYIPVVFSKHHLYSLCTHIG